MRFAKAAESSFDRFTLNPSPAEQAWMRDHYWRMRAYAPYFDSRLAWFEDAWAYQDLYAIYRGSELAEEHPDWILRDARGNKLYIPFGCSGGTCPQYAADFGNQAFRDWWIAHAAEKLAKGYRGLFVDDVNMDFRAGDGAGRSVVPHDPRTGGPMTLANWRRYVADFTEQIKRAFPDREIVHNAIWFAGCGEEDGSCWSDPHIRRQLLSADLIELERGVNDAGITGGGGRWGYETFMARIDWLHANGKGVVFDANATDESGREYGLASYFLVSSGRDALGNELGGRPDDWWPGYDVRLGAPAGGRYASDGLLRRDFEHGFVLVNRPGGQTRTVQLPADARGPDGAPRPAVTLDGAEGAVVVTSTSTSSAPAVAPGRQPTRTIVDPKPHPVAPAAERRKRRKAGRRLRLPRAVMVRGRVKRAAAGRARIRLQRKTKHGWKNVRRARVRVHNGRFRRLFRGLPAGRYRVRGAYLGSPGAKVSASRLRRFEIRPRR